MFKKFWKDYLSFSKKERTALFILFFVVLAIVILPSFFPAKEMNITVDAQLQKQLDSITQQESLHQNNFVDTLPKSDSSNKKITTASLFIFDPNTLDEQGFLKLGLNTKVIHTIISYRNKGGYFKSPQDIKKVYGLSTADAERLIPYINISSGKSSTDKKEETPVARESAINQKTETSTKTYHTININTATTDDWKTFPGIGDVIGNRIVKYRNSIGGFKSVDDVKKTYGLSDSTFNSIRPYLTLQ